MRPFSTSAAALLLLGVAPASALAEAPVVAVFRIEDDRPKRKRLADDKLEALTDFLRSQLAVGGKFQVVPPAEVQAALRTRKADSYKQCYDEACQIEVGKELAAEKSLATKIGRIGGQCVITSTLYDLARATTESSAPHRGTCKEEDLLTGLERIVAVLRGDKTPTQGFARARFEVGALDPMQDLQMDNQGVSFAGLDVDYLKLVQAAKRQEKAKKADPSKCSKAWSAVARYKGKNPLADQAKARVGFWTKADKLAKRYRADKRKLDELLALDDDVLPPAQKTAAEGEFKAGYGPYGETLRRIGLDFPWPQLSTGEFCPRGAQVRRKAKVDKAGETTSTTEWCVVKGKSEGPWIKVAGKKRTEAMMKAGKKHGRYVELFGGKKRLETTYEAGKREGLYRKWATKNGQLVYRARYVRGQIEGVVEEWHGDGTKRRRANFKAGKKEGVEEYWRSSGERSSRSYFRAGKRDRVYEAWHSNGTLTRRSPYKNGKKEGVEEQWYSTGELSYRATFRAGRLEGVTESFHKDGSASARKRYVKGKLQGPEITLHGNGKKNCVYAIVDGKRDGKAECFYSSGARKAQRTYAKGKRSGPYALFRQDGSKKESGRYVDDKLDGQITFWRADGKRSAISTYRSGNRDGPYRSWDAAGRKRAEYGYQDGKLSGPYRTWSASGKLTRQSTYSAHKPAGTYKTWFSNGKPREEGRYASGKREGAWVYYSQAGRRTKVRHYAQGKMQGKLQLWHANGKLKEEANYAAGKLHGERRWFKLDGTLAGKSTFVEGTGDHKSFRLDGSLASEGRYEGGKKVGTWTVYFPGGRTSQREVYEGGALRERVEYYANGKLRRVQTKEGGKLHGRFAVFSPDGKVIAESSFDQGTGEYLQVDRYGHVVERGRYDKGKKTGTWTSYFDNGQPQWVRGTERDQYVGPYKYFNREGVLTSQQHYVAGKAEGAYERNHANGKPMVRGQYAVGQRHGAWKYFDDAGQPVGTEQFRYGTGTDIGFEGGKRASTWPRLAGSAHGVVKGWHPNGKVFWERTYALGSKEGPERGFYADGKKMWVGQHQRGSKRGVWTYYKPDGSVLHTTDYDADRYVEIALGRSGQKLRETERHVGRRDGRVRGWDRETGHLVEDKVYVESTFLGGKYFYAATGKRRKVIEYDANRRRTGLWQVFSESGPLVCKVDFTKPRPEVVYGPGKADAAPKQLRTCRSFELDALEEWPP